MRSTTFVVFSLIIICMMPMLSVDASEDGEECYFTINDDCDHYNSVKSVSSFDGSVASLSGDGDYVASIDSVTGKYTIYDTEDLSIWNEDYLMPGYTFGMDHVSYNLVTYNETQCTYATEPNRECVLEEIHTQNENPPWNGVGGVGGYGVPDHTYVDETSAICEISDSGWFDDGWCGNGAEEGYLRMEGLRLDNKWLSPNGEYYISFSQFLVDEDWIEDDYDGILLANKIYSWNLNRSGVETGLRQVAIAVDEMHIIHDDTSDPSEDVVGVTWSPDAKVAYIVTSTDIFSFSTEDHSFSNIEWLSSGQQCNFGAGDSVDLGSGNLQLSADGSTMIYSCDDKSWIVLFSKSDWSWFSWVALIAGILVLAWLSVYAYKNYRTSGTLWLAVMIVFAGCLGSGSILPDNPGFQLESAPADGDLVATINTNGFVPIESIDVWVDVGDDTGFWCSITIQEGEDSNGAWKTPGNRYFTAIKTNPDAASYCPGERCEWSAETYYLGKLQRTVEIIQF